MLDDSRLKEIILHSAPSGPPAGDSNRLASVFLLLFNRSDPRILAIQKSDTKGYPWRNQVALPGGHLEQTDAGPVAAAFREIEEELKISRDQVDFIGSIGHFKTLTRPRDIEAFIGIWNGKGPIRHDATEISRILELSLRKIFKIHQENLYHEHRPDPREIEYPYEDVIIWGATAQIIYRFIELVYPLLENSNDDRK
jgi:8-oxo-dGTP pyrophosphatase MutT (NUDIX family)